jgi:hypothetical protein
MAVVFSIAVAFTANAAVITYKETRPVLPPYAKGGSVEIFMGMIADSKREGIRRELVGECVSSCTLFTNLMKNGLVCARPGTVLVFHQFVIATDLVIEGNIIKSYKVGSVIRGPEFERIWSKYPYIVKKMLMKRSPNGGLPPHGQELKISADDLGIPGC